MGTLSRQGIRLTGLTAVLWLALAGPAYWVAGVRGLEGLSYAALLCLLPGWLAFSLVSRYGVGQAQAYLALAGTVLRLLFVLSSVLALRSLRPGLGLPEFVVWVVVFYLATLAAETWILLKDPPGSRA